MNEFKRVKYACYVTNLAISAVACLSPLLFVTFRNMYGFSYTMLGFLVVVNFVTQLLTDLVFSFLSHKFNIEKTVKTIPLIMFFGFLIYAVMPNIFIKSAYLWIMAGTVILAVSGGLSEVLLNPVIASIPSKTPEADLSKLHSSYAWGVVGVVIISTVFLKLVGNENWMYLVLFWSPVSLVALWMFVTSDFPFILNETEARGSGFSFELILFMGCIFLGGAAECTMHQWISGFAEKSLGIPKVAGDIFGFALFALFLGLGRTLYAKIGKNISRVLMLGMAGAAVCYIVSALSINPAISLVFCISAGFCVSMLWPGTIIYAGEKIKNPSVSMYAFLAAGGDLGASVAPQLMGIVTDKVSFSDFADILSRNLLLTSEQIGMRCAMVVSAVFPVLGILILLYIKKYYKKNG